MAFIQNTITDLDDLLYQISNITASGGDITVTTSVAHNITYAAGMKMAISGTTAFDGEYDMSAATGSSITLTSTGITATETAGQAIVNNVANDGTYFTQEITLDVTNSDFTLNAAGNLSTAGSGVTGQALYSFFKERWKEVPSITKYKFPMLSITNEQFEFINDWIPSNDTTRKMIRSAGWAEVKTGGSVGRRYAGIVSLGTLGSSDQPYFVQNSSYTATTDTTDFTGPINEAVQIFGDTGVDATSPFNEDRSTYFKLFVRTRGKTYADADLTDIGVTSGMTYIVYRFPLSNANDLNIKTTHDNAISGATITNITGDGSTITVTATNHGLYIGAPVTISGTTNWNGDYTVAGVTDLDNFTISSTTNPADETAGTTKLSYVDAISLSYLPNPDDNLGDVVIRGEYRGDNNDATITYDLGDVVWNGGTGGDNRWYYLDATDSNPSIGTNVASDTNKTWTAWADGERNIESDSLTYSAYSIVYDLNSAGATPGAPKEIAYEYAQYLLRQSTDINDSIIGTSSARNGEVADTLVYFVGSQLHTYNDSSIPSAVVIDDIANADLNNITYHDVGVADVNGDATDTHFAPTVVLVSINFNEFLSTDNNAVFYAYYTAGEGAQAGSNNFGDSDALQVVDKDGNPVGFTTNAAMTGPYDVPSTGYYEFSYSFTQDTTNGRTGLLPVNITVLAIGLDTGQYVSTTGNITSAGGSFALTAARERNYTDPNG